MTQDILKHLGTLVHEITGIPLDAVRPEASIDNELEMKSVDFMRIHVALEEHFDVELDALLILELNRVDAICSYVESCVRKSAPPPNRPRH